MQSSQEQSTLTRRILLLLLGLNIPITPFSTYVASLLVGMERPEDVRVVVGMLLFVVLFNAGLVLLLAVRAMVRGTFALRPGDDAGARLERILKLPARLGFYCVQLTWFHAGATFMVGVSLLTGQSLKEGLPVTAMATAFGILLSFPVVPILEKWTMPAALAEQQRIGGRRATGRGYFWPRQSWHLPYSIASALLATIFLAAVVVVIKVGRVQAQFVAQFQDEGATLLAARMQQASSALLDELGLPFLGIASLIFIFPTLVAWLQVWRQTRAMGTVEQAITSLAHGLPQSPEWVSTDEAGDLADGLKLVLAKLREIPITLQNSASQLAEAGVSLRSANDQQRQSINLQASALHEVHVTSEEIKQTSDVAVVKATSVLKVSERVEELGRMGEQAIQQSLGGLSSMHQFVEDMRDKVARLEGRARQIGSITATVKGIADKSNMLALNASIEAVRSGEHGKGFSVVAREIRGLADQSIQATARIRDILEEIGTAINDAVELGDKGSLQLERGMQMVKVSGENFRELSHIIQESTSGARQISATVRQQNEGISQIFTAIQQLSTIMDHTVKRIEATQEATDTLKLVSESVMRLAHRYEEGHRKKG
jgi:methyl-accepting chemotaxis protein